MQLQVAVGDVVADGVAEDVGERVALGDVAALCADDGDQFAFVVEAFAFLGEEGDRDRVEGPGGGGAGLVEEDRGGGDGHLGFEGVGAVVEAEAADCGDGGGREGGEEAGDGGRGGGEGVVGGEGVAG